MSPEDSAAEPGWRPDKPSAYEHAHPPPEATALTDDGQLHMLTLREGSGEAPPKHARCLGGARSAMGWRQGAGAAQKPRGQGRRRRRPPPLVAAGPSAQHLPAICPVPPQCTMWGGWQRRGSCSWTPARRARRRSRSRLWRGAVRGRRWWRQRRLAVPCLSVTSIPPALLHPALRCDSHTRSSPSALHLPPCRQGVPRGGAEPGGGAHAPRRRGARVGGPRLRLRRPGLLFLPHRAPQCQPSVSLLLPLHGQPSLCHSGFARRRSPFHLPALPALQLLPHCTTPSPCPLQLRAGAAGLGGAR